MFIRALIAFIVLPGVVAGVVPFLIVRGRGSTVSIYGVAPLLIGAILLLWCVRDFYVAGKGTLAPWDPPKHLVVVGLYKFVRNPMYVAVLTIVAGWALLFHSMWLAVYLALVAVGFHLRVLYYEEPTLKRQFGLDWQAYERQVPRWIPRFLKVRKER